MEIFFIGYWTGTVVARFIVQNRFKFKIISAINVATTFF